MFCVPLPPQLLSTFPFLTHMKYGRSRNPKVLRLHTVSTHGGRTGAFSSYGPTLIPLIIVLQPRFRVTVAQT